MRYSKQISTGRLLGSQSGGDTSNPQHLQVLRNNAEQHLPANDIEVGYCTGDELAVMLESLLTDLEKIIRSREQEYPPATDYLDGVVKGDQGQIDQYIADCLAVKQRFPK